MESTEYDDILRRLTAAIEHQRLINEDLREFNQQQVGVNERLTAAIERLDVTQARIETLLQRVVCGSGNGREA